MIKFVSDLWQVGGFLRVLLFPQPIKLTTTLSWNIVESGVKNHNPNPYPLGLTGDKIHPKCFSSLYLNMISV
jgi:hypothetical protein